MEKLCVAASDRATVFGDYVISLEVGKDFTYHVEKGQDDREPLSSLLLVLPFEK